jgi:hypothetical protein
MAARANDRWPSACWARLTRFGSPIRTEMSFANDLRGAEDLAEVAVGKRAPPPES